jgi:hypothetical protein
MNKKLMFAAAFAVIGAGCATASSPELSEKAAERLADFKPTGETRSCLPLTHIRTIDALDDSHFLVETRNGDYYLNVVSGRCSSASRPGYFIEYSVSGSTLCRNEIVRVIDNTAGMTVGSCGLGDFQALEEAPSADES